MKSVLIGQDEYAPYSAILSIKPPTSERGKVQYLRCDITLINGRMISFGLHQGTGFEKRRDTVRELLSDFSIPLDNEIFKD